MKKIFAISLIAMAAVTSARADIASQAYVDQQDEAIEAKITTLNANASTEGSVAYKIAQSITSTYDGTDESKAVTGKAVASAISDVTSTANSAIKGVKVNGSALTPTEGIVDVTVPTGALASKSTIADADVASDAAIAQSKIANLTTDLGSKAAASDLSALTTLVGTLPSGITATTVTGYVAEAASGASTAALGNLDVAANDATGEGNVVTQVTQDNGQIAVVKGITALQQSDVAQTYSSTGTAPVSGAAVASAISDLDLGNTYEAKGTAAGLIGDLDGSTTGTGNVVDSVTETDGVVTVTKNITAVTVPTSNENSTAGTYVLTSEIAQDGTKTYHWELISRATPANP